MERGGVHLTTPLLVQAVQHPTTMMIVLAYYHIEGSIPLVELVVGDAFGCFAHNLPIE